MELSDFFAKQWKLIVGLFIVVGLIGAIIVFNNMRALQKEKLAQESYFTVEKKLLDLKAKKTNPPSEIQTNNKTAVKPQTPAGAEVVDFSQSKKDLEKLIIDYPDSIAAQMAAVHLANLLVDEKNFEMALNILKKVENKDKGLVNTLVQQQIGQLLSDTNKCQEAIAVWQLILDRKEAGFMHNETKIQQALCYTNLNNFKKAEEILTNLSNQAVNPELGDSSKEAEKYLRLIQFKKASGT